VVRPVTSKRKAAEVIFIVVKFKVKPEHADQWPELSREFTEATRAEPGNLWFDWSRSVDDPNEYVLVEAFKDDAAEAHVKSGHFAKAMAEQPQYLQETPRIISRQIDGEGWDQMGEMTVA
jgi:quinol monooxygenase YgiN